MCLLIYEDHFMEFGTFFCFLSAALSWLWLANEYVCCLTLISIKTFCGHITLISHYNLNSQNSERATSHCELYIKHPQVSSGRVLAFSTARDWYLHKCANRPCGTRQRFQLLQPDINTVEISPKLSLISIHPEQSQQQVLHSPRNKITVAQTAILYVSRAF